MKSKANLLKTAAMNYGTASADLDGAIIDRAPDVIVAAMIINRDNAKKNLCDAAMQYWEDSYDA